MAERQPLLTVAIPTYNRSPYLRELLECLLPQLAGRDEAELLISDNASVDDTAAMVAGFEARGLCCRFLQNAENLGPDVNFLRCLDLAEGKYVWVLGDDDLLVEHALPDVLSLLAQGEAGGGFDLAYLSSFGFTGAYQTPAPDALKDPLGRFAEVVTDGEYFLNKVNALIALISAVIVNKEKLQARPYPPIAELHDSNLLQLGWLFPLLERRCRVLYVWQRLLAYRTFNSGGWGICEVFGLRMHRIAQRYFAAEPGMDRALMNGVLRYWMPDVLIQLRRKQNQDMHEESATAILGPVFGRNWRYRVFVWSVAALPLPLAGAWHTAMRLGNKATRGAGTLLRHAFRRGQPLQPARLMAPSKAAGAGERPGHG